MKSYDFKFDGFSVERREFDKYLADKAVGEGAELKTNVKVTNFDGNKIVTRSGEEFTGKVIVGADGYRSRIAEMAGFKVPGTLYRCILCEMPGDFEPTVEMYFGSVAPGGYAWVIPKADSANIGLGIRNKGDFSLKALFKRFLESKRLKTKPRFWSAGYVPVSGPIPQTVKNNVLVVGDAAGQVMATNGGGIPISMICGRIAGNVIGQHFRIGQPLEKYETEWRQSVGKELAVSLRTKKLADVFFKNDRALGIAMSLIGEKRMNRAIKCKPVFFERKINTKGLRNARL
jgi:digeranylgeranylglycerophospholipid reductase